MRTGMRRTTTGALALTMALALAACSSSDGDDAIPAPSATSLVAQVNADVAEITAFDGPGSDAAVEDSTLANPKVIVDDEGRGGEVPVVFLVKDDSDDDWLEVYLPIRPNGATGWVPRDDVTLREVPYRVEVNLSDFQLELFRNGRVVLESAVGLGAIDEPTPPGTYFITELLQPPDPDTVYGAYAFGLSGFSDVNFEFGGGPGQLGLHGTNDPSSIGTNASAGCIRLPNEVIEELATVLPLGTPVEIVA